MSSIEPAVPMETLVEFIWSQYEFMIKSTNNTVVNLPGHIVDVIGDVGMSTIARSLSEMIGAPVKRSMDGMSGMVRIMPANFNLGHKTIIKGGPAPKNPVVKKDKTPRPPNAFILYRQRHHPLLRAKYPTLHNNQISIILGKQWQLATEETKAHFKDAADALKKKHLLAHPGYQYQPRKPSEKKRRMTRRRNDRTSSTGIATNLNPGELAIEPTDIDHGVPDFETTAAGNPTFDLGDDNYEDNTVGDMLANFNVNLGHNPSNLPGAILYSEPIGEAQDDFNLFDTFLHFDKLLADA